MEYTTIGAYVPFKEIKDRFRKLELAFNLRFRVAIESFSLCHFK